MGMFKSTKNDLAAGPDVPIDQITAMRQQGYSNNQIIQTLQRDGYTSSQIFDAISQSEMNAGQNAGQMGQEPMNFQTQQLGQQLPPIMPQQQMQSSSSMQQIPISGLQSTPEELIEAIIEEKWNELVKDINKVLEWKQKADSKLMTMEQQLNDMQSQFDKLHQAIIGKVGDYDKHILDVSTQLQAMEKVFGKVLPTFIDNVNELNTITQRVKDNDISRSAKIFEKKPKKIFEEKERL
jgi:hypothetical protein